MNVSLSIPQVCVIHPHPTTGSISYHVISVDRLRYETADVRTTLGLAERDNIYYYKIPTTLGDKPQFRFYTACVQIVLEKFK